MGLIKEPKNVDFYVIDESWPEKELKEFSALIKQRKEQLKKAEQRKAIRAKRRLKENRKSR